MEPSRRLLSKTRESRAVKGERFSSVLINKIKKIKNKNKKKKVERMKKKEDDENPTSQ